MGSVTKTWAFGLVLLTTILTTVAQYFLKTGVALWPALFTNTALLAGICLYAIGSAVMILAFKGGQVSELYPVFASSYIWVALVANFFLGESVHLLRWSGIAIIIIGISVIGYASRETQ